MARVTTTPDEPTGTETVEQQVLDAAEAVVEDVTETELDAEDVAAMDSFDVPRRLLLVHAHPDDETIGNGVTMARYAAAGAHVTLVTCTRGEQGEVIPEDLRHLQGDGDALAERRVEELGTAMEALGVTDHRFLGDDVGSRYRDSGMAWGPDGRAVAAPDTPVGAFALADLDEAAGHLVRVLREVRPQVVVTYEPGGGYGHPDHVQAHRVAVRALELSAVDAGDGGEPWHVAKVYETVVPESVAADFWEDRPFPSMVVPDAEVTTVVESPENLEAKVAALRAHHTQVRVEGGDMRLSSGPARPVPAVEAYRLVQGVTAPDREDGRESDLFAGVA